MSTSRRRRRRKGGYFPLFPSRLSSHTAPFVRLILCWGSREAAAASEEAIKQQLAKDQELYRQQMLADAAKAAKKKEVR